jgi:hypothetical protein
MGSAVIGDWVHSVPTVHAVHLKASTLPCPHEKQECQVAEDEDNNECSSQP